ncbi:MAG: basic amino acid ABC transporter substrate-binding protein [Alkalispirochaeta sp.]
MPRFSFAILAELILSVMLIGVAPQVHSQSALQWSPEETRRFESLPAITVATDSTWPPMEYINRDGDLVGFDIDLLREIGLRQGFRPEFITVAWDGIFAGLLAGRYEMIASSVTLLEERTRVMRFSEPYFVAAQYLLVPGDDETTGSLTDLAGGEVGAQIGTTGSRIAGATPGVTVRAYDDLALAVEDLARGRLDGLVADSAIVEYFLGSAGAYRREIRIAGSPYTVEEYAFAIDPDRPGLQRRINEGLAAVRKDGTLRRFREFWFPGITGAE